MLKNVNLNIFQKIFQLIFFVYGLSQDKYNHYVEEKNTFVTDIKLLLVQRNMLNMAMVTGAPPYWPESLAG